jgi:hypothetical protein
LRVAEKDQTIESMTRTIEELKRKAEQGSQQSQGEVLELELEELLRGRFPTDSIEPVGKGELVADVIQQVNGAIGQSAGIILWETKRTKAWSDGWLAKLRDDRRRSGADIALIISHALPKHIEQFDLVDGVWVAHPRCALPVAVALRQGLIDVSSSRLVQQGQQTKMEQVYQYLTGTKFRQRVEAVVEKFSDMRVALKAGRTRGRAGYTGRFHLQWRALYGWALPPLVHHADVAPPPRPGSPGRGAPLRAVQEDARR